MAIWMISNFEVLLQYFRVHFQLDFRWYPRDDSVFSAEQHGRLCRHHSWRSGGGLHQMLGTHFCWKLPPAWKRTLQKEHQQNWQSAGTKHKLLSLRRMGGSHFGQGIFQFPSFLKYKTSDMPSPNFCNVGTNFFFQSFGIKFSG